MKFIITCFFMFIFTATAHADEWFSGGTLHGSTMEEWTLAEQRDKVATAADWMVTVLGQDNFAKAYSKWQPMAVQVADCVDQLIPTVAESFDVKEEKATSLAVLCITTFKEKDWKGYF